MSEGPRLAAANASAALLLLEDGRYVLQLRDDKPGIWYPGHWGCFGGAAEPGEPPLATLRRELAEELGIEVGRADWLTRFTFDLRPFGAAECTRDYYVVPISGPALACCRLAEGAAVAAFTPDAALRDLRLVPYDSFAIYLHSHRGIIS